jgi:hypothetical protein
MKTTTAHFTEKSRFPKLHRVIVLLLFISNIVFGYYFSKSDITFYISIGISLVIFFIIFFGYGEITLRNEGVHFKFWPFVSRKIDWSAVSQVVRTTVNPIKEFGGWGIRYNPKTRTTAYIFNLSSGVLITLKNGKQVFIGTSNPDTILKAFANQGA